MLQRTLEPEILDTFEDSEMYDMMDHALVNRNFAESLAETAPVGNDFCDLGTGTALIPIELCRLLPSIRIMACDSARSMLELARYRIEIAGLRDRVQLHFGDAKKLVFQDKHFDCVFSNTLLHHLPDPSIALKEAIRVLKPDGLLFMRDLCRPSSVEKVESIVEIYGREESEAAKQLLRQSLHAALTLEEIQELVGTLGLPAESVLMTSDRHWTLVHRA